LSKIEIAATPAPSVVKRTNCQPKIKWK